MRVVVIYFPSDYYKYTSNQLPYVHNQLKSLQYLVSVNPRATTFTEEILN